jgi:hypothetical protein
MKTSSLLTTAFIVLSMSLLAGPGLCREQWQMNHPTGTPPTQAMMPMGMVPRANPQDFWKGQLANRIPAGTVLSGILQQDLASHKTQRGEIFEILLQDGFAVNGNMVVPPHTKIVGTVIAAMPAAMHKHGNPGRLQIALQAMVFPNGQSVPFFGFIDQNSNMDPAKEQKTEGPGHKIKDWGNSLNAFATQFGGGIGANMARRHRGAEFKLEKGELVPVRLNRSLDVPPNATAPVMAGGGMQPGQQQYAQQPSVPGLAVPDPQAPAPLADDPNGVFSQPVNPRPLNDLPDPF